MSIFESMPGKNVDLSFEKCMRFRRTLGQSVEHCSLHDSTSPSVMPVQTGLPLRRILLACGNVDVTSSFDCIGKFNMRLLRTSTCTNDTFPSNFGMLRKLLFHAKNSDKRGNDDFEKILSGNV